jgi:NAD(P)-dependent dehydrogenase (short-subunit alcohol dehydrogenase family)
MNTLDSAGENAVVTGGTQGIGAAIVARLRASGAQVVIRNLVNVEAVASLVCWRASAGCSFSTGGVFDISGGRATY